MVSGGDGCVSRSNNTFFSNRTEFVKTSPINANGTIARFCIWINHYHPSTLKLKIFRQNGTNIDFVGESQTCTITGTGANSFNIDTPITVQAGDYIGVSAPAQVGTEIATASDNDATYGVFYQDGVDITTNTPEADWSIFSLISKLSISVGLLNDVYVDINKSDDTGNGQAFATAKKTMKAGWDILNSAGTMHVATGDYSAQTTIAYNKSWKLSCEDPNSTGLKSVKIPRST